MGSYDRNRESEGSKSDPQLEEPMWKLRLSDAEAEVEAYPERPSEVVCRYYMKTGVCGFGASCRFHHPRDGASPVVDVVKHGGEEYPERVGQPICKYYMTSGNCKFGSSCKFHHPKDGGGTNISVNSKGYPIRPGEKECSYYLRTGECKFGATCKFHHPEPVDSHIPVTNIAHHGSISTPIPGVHIPPQSSPIPASHPYGITPGNWQVVRNPHFLPGPYPHLQGPYSPFFLPPGMVPGTSWGPYPVHMSPVISPGFQPILGPGLRYGIPQVPSLAQPFTGPYSPILSSPSALNSSQKELAEHPDQPDCRNYKKTGRCKYGSSCKYRHPSEGNASNPATFVGQTYLPVYPGVPYCNDYAQHGFCKFGSSSKLYHPTGAGTLSYSPSASSLAEVPVASYPVHDPVGSSATSSSSPDRQPDISSRSSKESTPTRISSALSSSSGSISSVPTKTEPMPISL